MYRKYRLYGIHIYAAVNVLKIYYSIYSIHIFIKKK